jgi:hypothetical protein
MGIALFEAAFDAVTLGLALFILHAVLFINGQVAVGVRDGVAA